jgi:choline dehydrogenase-like flavoprotein
MAEKFSDVVVIGSGAGGGAVAFKLAKLGIKVVVLEKGEARNPAENTEDELAEIQLERHRPLAEDDPTVVVSGGQIASEASRVGQAFYLLGGGTTRYTATSWRLRPKDFKKLSTYGKSPGISLADWPITYEELEPYYTEAEYEIGVSGLPGIDPTEPHRSKNVMMPPLKRDNFQEILEKAGKSLGWKPFPIPVAIHSKINSHTGGSSCMQCGWCSGFPCQYRAKSSVELVLFPRAQDTGNFDVKSNAYATKIVMKNKKVAGVEYINTDTGETEFIGCKVLVLAASAIQTTRLLMMSSAGSQNALANSSGLLGKNLMFHIEAKGSAVFEENFHQQYYKKTGFHDFYYPGKEDDFINHRSIQSGSKAGPISFALSRSGFGPQYFKQLQNEFLRTQEVQCMVEDLAQEKNYVGLSEKFKDPWGFPSPEIHHEYHEQDRKAAMAAVQKIKILLEAAGGKNIEIPETLQKNITGRYTWHLMGTARMGNNPETSVLNKDCQSHDISNLFITDGSGFCTSGGLNPTLTIQALALRTAVRIKALMKEGKV